MRGKGLPSGIRVPTSVSLVDLVPTILGILRIPLPPQLDGLDLQPLWDGGDAAAFFERDIFGEADHGLAELDITRSVRRGRHKLHYNRLTEEFQLFDLVSDPREQHDVAGERKEVAQDLRATLREFSEQRTQAAPAAGLSSEERELLLSLGYLGRDE
jgi:arylsulfatase A-like enzyme